MFQRKTIVNPILDSSLVCFEVLLFFCNLDFILNPSDFLQYLTMTLDNNISNILPHLWLVITKIKTAFFLKPVSWSWTNWHKLQRNHHNSLYMNNFCDIQIANHLEWFARKSVRLPMPILTPIEGASSSPSRNLDWLPPRLRNGLHHLFQQLIFVLFFYFHRN